MKERNIKKNSWKKYRYPVFSNYWKKSLLLDFLNPDRYRKQTWGCFSAFRLNEKKMNRCMEVVMTQVSPWIFFRPFRDQSSIPLKSSVELKSFTIFLFSQWFFHYWVSQPLSIVRFFGMINVKTIWLLKSSARAFVQVASLLASFIRLKVILKKNK